MIILRIITLLFFLIPLSSSAIVVKFDSDHVLDNGGSARTEVMVAETTQEELEWKVEELKKFLSSSGSVSKSKFIYAAPSDSTLRRRNWQEVIPEEEVLQKLGGLNFAETEKIDIPSEWFEPEKGRTPQSEVVTDLQEEFNKYYAKNFKTRRITLIASRTIVNGSVASIAFIAGGMPMAPSIVLGSLTGILSGSLQLISKQLLEYVESNKYEMKLRRLAGLKSGAIKTSSFLAQQMKWFSTELLFLTILDLARFSLGQLPNATLGQEILSIGTTSIKSLGSQGLVDTSMAKDLGPRIRDAIQAKDFEKAAALRFRNEIVAFSASMAWAAAAVTDMMGMPVGNFIFAGMGSVGAANHLRLILRDKKNTIKAALTPKIECSSFFRRLRGQ